MTLYIRNLWYLHLIPVFQLHNEYCEFSYCTHKFKWLLCTENQFLNAGFKISNFQIWIFIRLVLKRTVQAYFKAIIRIHRFFQNKSEAKIYISKKTINTYLRLEIRVVFGGGDLMLTCINNIVSDACIWHFQ